MYSNSHNHTQDPRDTVDTHVIISKVAYLIGVGKSIFENEYEPPLMDVFYELEKERSARIIRSLCALRTAIERNFSEVNNAMRYELKNLDTLPQYIPCDHLNTLEQNGIVIVKANRRLNQYIMDINGLIAQHISGCQQYFPIWINWKYMRSLFLMPDGQTDRGIRRAAAEYYANMSQYPYQVYINWRPAEQGNILFNDQKFLTLLYQQHGDSFKDSGKVRDVALQVKGDIYEFLERCDCTVIIVDCENSDPYKLHAMLSSLKQNVLLEKVVKVILYNDIHTSTAWKILDQFTGLQVEHNMTTRLKEHKSLVDIELTTGVCREHYENDIDAFILVSSDSDYWGLISSMPQIQFMVMVEESKCAQATKNALDSHGVMYCCIDSFCSGNSSKIMISALLNEVRNDLQSSLDLNLNQLLDKAYRAVRVNMTELEKQQFYSRYIKSLRIVFAEDGQAIIQMG